MSDVEYHLRQAEAAARLALVEPDPAMAITLRVLALAQYEKAEKAESNAALACRPFFANDNNRTANG